MVEIETTATELHWQSFGEGKDLVLLHGWGMNGAVWQQTAQRLSQHFHVHIVDLPGFGHSHQASFSSLADLTQQVLDEAPAQACLLYTSDAADE